MLKGKVTKELYQQKEVCLNKLQHKGWGCLSTRSRDYVPRCNSLCRANVVTVCSNLVQGTEFVRDFNSRIFPLVVQFEELCQGLSLPPFENAISRKKPCQLFAWLVEFREPGQQNDPRKRLMIPWFFVAVVLLLFRIVDTAYCLR